MEMHDLLMLKDIIENKFDYKLERENEHARTTRQAVRVVFCREIDLQKVATNFSKEQ